MQPDTILLEKEWPDLSDTEKQLLASLVSNEAEFRLLKKALLVSIAAKEEVPVLSTRIKSTLTNQLPTQAPVRKMRIPFWIKMAAAVFVLAIASFVYWNRANNHQPERDKSISKNPVPVAPSSNIPAEKEIAQTIPPTQAKTPEPVIAQKQQIQSNLKKGSTITPTKNTGINIKNIKELEMNTLVQSDPGLLENITEVY